MAHYCSRYEVTWLTLFLFEIIFIPSLDTILHEIIGGIRRTSAVSAVLISTLSPHGQPCSWVYI